jgi:hypothetical protein
MVTCRNLLPKYDDSRKKKIPPNLATLDNSFHKYPMYELALDYLWSPSEEDLLKEKITDQIILLTPNFLDCDVQF